jgi:hypothetical protein
MVPGMTPALHAANQEGATGKFGGAIYATIIKIHVVSLNNSKKDMSF